MLGHMSASLEIGDLPIVPANMRATTNFQSMKTALRIPINPLSIPLSSSRLFSFRRGSGWELLCKLVRLNKWVLIYEITLAAVSAVLWYTPTFFLQKLVKYIEDDELREDRRWGWVFVAGLLGFNIVCDLGKFLILNWQFKLLFNLMFLQCSHRSNVVNRHNIGPGPVQNPA